MEIELRTQLLVDLYEGRKVTDKEFRSNPALIKQHIKTVNKLKAATRIEDLFQLHSLKYKKLVGRLSGKSSVRINGQYRLIFVEEAEEAEPLRVVLLGIEEISKHYE